VVALKNEPGNALGLTALKATTLIAKKKDNQAASNPKTATPKNVLSAHGQVGVLGLIVLPNAAQKVRARGPENAGVVTAQLMDVKATPLKHNHVLKNAQKFASGLGGVTGVLVLHHAVTLHKREHENAVAK